MFFCKSKIVLSKLSDSKGSLYFNIVQMKE